MSTCEGFLIPQPHNSYNTLEGGELSVSVSHVQVFCFPNIYYNFLQIKRN